MMQVSPRGLTAEQRVDIDQAIVTVAAHLESLQARIVNDFRSPTGVSSKGDGSTVTDTDPWVENQLTPVCLTAIPGSFVVGEETVHNYQDRYAEILEHEFVWAIDGIDGTQNFINGSPLFAPSVGLLQRTPQGHVCVGGAVLFPALGELYYSRNGAVILKDLACGEESMVQSRTPTLGSHSMITAPDNLAKLIRTDERGPAVRVQGCAVADILYVGKGAFAGTISDYALWDFAGALALAQLLGVRLQDAHTGQVKTAFAVDDFEAGSLKRQWCLAERYILSRPEHFNFVRQQFQLTEE